MAARELSAEAQAEKKRIEDEKKKLKKDQKDQRKEAKRRAKEIAKQEEALGEEEGNAFVTFIATLFIVVLWLAVIFVVVKLDIGGFGSSVLTPILKDVPVLSKILPGVPLSEITDSESYGGYSSLSDAVDYIRELELEIERLQNSSAIKDSDLEELRAQVARLKEFENSQVEFQRIEREFYEEVLASGGGIGAEEFRKWFEEMNPSLAESLYRQVVVQLEESAEFQTYASAFAEMKPKAAAETLEEMMNTDTTLVARILNTLSVEERAAIMNQMSAANTARIAKIMKPDS